MKIVFVSNFLNHHQLGICQEFENKYGENFKFISLESIPQDRVSMNYKDMNHMYPFVINAYESDEEYIRAERLVYDSDIVIIGGCNESIARKRIESNKITFKYFERIYKRGLWRVFSPGGLKYMISEHSLKRNKNVYLLCASAYTPFDFRLVNAYPKKMFKWGYFPKTQLYDDVQHKFIADTHNPLKILWTGRMLSWKHPEVVIQIAKLCREHHMNVEFHMIGDGELHQYIKSQIAYNGLTDIITLETFKDNSEVLKDMINSDIFLATSDYQEGWGAVINEAMSCGCVTIASHAMGAAPYLIEDGINGYIYQNGKINEAFEYIQIIYNDTTKRLSVQKNAFNTINQLWNSKIAVDRLIKVATALLEKSHTTEEYADGPMSLATPIADWCMYRFCKEEKNRK